MHQAPNSTPAAGGGYAPTRDPLYYATVGFFAFLTTALPGILGQPRFMPLIQALALSVLLAMAVRKGETRHAVWAAAIWVAVQLVVFALLSWLFTARAERAISDGFLARGAMAEWYFGTVPFPDSIVAAPWRRLGEVAGVAAGAVLTAGLAGYWFLARAINLVAFQAGAILTAAGLRALPAALPFWSLLRLAGLTGLAVLFSEPLLTRNWAPGFYWHQRRRLLLWSLALLAGALILESFMPGPWRAFFSIERFSGTM